MENREITLADIFLDVLSKSQDKGAKLMAERIKAAIKSPKNLKLVNICVINQGKRSISLTWRRTIYIKLTLFREPYLLPQLLIYINKSCNQR